jgi:hypothetical protein
MTENNNESIEQTKKCFKCGEFKHRSLFNKRLNSRNGLQSWCKSCLKTYREANKKVSAEYAKAYYEANKEAILSQKKAYREANKEAILSQKKAYRKANKEVIAAKKKVHYEANKEAIAEKHKAYREANKEVLLAKKKVHYEANKSYYIEKSSSRKARKKTNTPKFIRDCSVDKKRRVFAYNLSRLLTETTGIQHHVDHMWPLSDGGPHWSGNLQVIPAVDNLSKHDKVNEQIKKTIQEGLEYARRESKRG